MFAGYREPKPDWTLMLTLPYQCSLFPGRFPNSVFRAVPLMGQRGHLPHRRDPQPGSSSVRGWQAGFRSLQEEKQFWNNWGCQNHLKFVFFLRELARTLGKRNHKTDWRGMTRKQQFQGLTQLLSGPCDVNYPTETCCTAQLLWLHVDNPTSSTPSWSIFAPTRFRNTRKWLLQTVPRNHRGRRSSFSGC